MFILCLLLMITVKKTWVYFLKQKYQAFDGFKSFKAMDEKESVRFIKVLRSDRGGEYVNIMELKYSLLLTTLHNKTKQQKKEPDHYEHGSNYNEGEASSE